MDTIVTIPMIQNMIHAQTTVLLARVEAPGAPPIAAVLPNGALVTSLAVPPVVTIPMRARFAARTAVSIILGCYEIAKA